MHELYSVSNSIQTRLTPLVGTITRRSNIDELGEQLDFDLAFNDDKYTPVAPVDIGSLIVLQNRDEIFRGIVVTETKNGRESIQYNCFDYAFYLNKSKGIYQFNKVKGEVAITTMLNEFSVPIGNIELLGIVVDKIYQEEISSIIKDILDQAEKQTGIKYRMEMRTGKLFIEKQQNQIIKASFKLYETGPEVDVVTAIRNPSRKRSIENMRNSIKVTGNDKVIAEARNETLIKQYGLLQEISQLDDKDIAQAKNIAQNMLKDLGKIFEESSIEVPGDDQVRAGRILEITESVTGMSGQYLIKDVTHTISGGLHTMYLGLEVI
ncbi:hypothetical protein BR63_19225 [Thermanaerosceptrum fracticalcis]|uniref:YqbQ/XkdQ domain-containing protein n=1 Tax=Thermanaerosceptrum fracticalcis TaxID=1712410 RepID=A0A7G6E810_THEFR|nr:hypothetical protein [Thermanaerosceptrum fracticalcis]QNB48214.1 hypothetical protein BR63_19225 [Thermanaerosceptrum fracticalcis]